MLNKKIIPIVDVKKLPINIDNDSIFCINQNSVNSYTHNFFKYPCKFIPEIPRWGLNKYIKNKQAIIFDPFAGSGTTILESIIWGYDAYYTEIDEVAKLIINVKTTQLSIKELTELEDDFKLIIKAAKNSKEYNIPKIDNLYHWFPHDSVVILGRMLNQIQKIRNEKIRNFYKICFASIIKKCSYADDSSPKPYISSKIKKIPANPIEEFKKVYHKYKKSEEELSKIKKIGKAIKLDGDALNFDSNKKFDLVITSPPYINAFDYGRTMRLENLWLGLLTEEQLRNKKSEYVGTEKVDVKVDSQDLSILNDSQHLLNVYNELSKIDKKRSIIVKKFFEDMKKNLININKFLIDDGYYMIVIGNSKIRNIDIDSSKIITDIALKHGFKLDVKYSYKIKNPYINIPRNGRGGKISYDNVIVLQKEVLGNGTTK